MHAAEWRKSGGRRLSFPEFILKLSSQTDDIDNKLFALLFDETHGNDITDNKSKVKLGAKVADKSDAVVRVDDEPGDKTDTKLKRKVITKRRMKTRQNYYVSH